MSFRSRCSKEVRREAVGLSPGGASAALTSSGAADCLCMEPASCPACAQHGISWPGELHSFLQVLLLQKAQARGCWLVTWRKLGRVNPAWG